MYMVHMCTKKKLFFSTQTKYLTIKTIARATHLHVGIVLVSRWIYNCMFFFGAVVVAAFVLLFIFRRFTFFREV